MSEFSALFLKLISIWSSDWAERRGGNDVPDSCVSRNGALIDPQFCREPGLVRLPSGNAQDRVEDGYGNSDFEFLVGQNLVTEKRQHVRMDAGLEGARGQRNRAQAIGGNASCPQEAYELLR